MRAARPASGGATFKLPRESVDEAGVMMRAMRQFSAAALGRRRLPEA